MRKTRQVPQLNILFCLSTGSSFYNGKKPVVSMSLKVLKFCQEESYKALYIRNLNYTKAKQEDLLIISKNINHTAYTVSTYKIHSILFTWVPSPVTGSLVLRTRRCTSKMTNSVTGTCHLLKVYDVFQPS